MIAQQIDARGKCCSLSEMYSRDPILLCPEESRTVWLIQPLLSCFPSFLHYPHDWQQNDLASSLCPARYCATNYVYHTVFTIFSQNSLLDTKNLWSEIRKTSLHWKSLTSTWDPFSKFCSKALEPNVKIQRSSNCVIWVYIISW